MLKFQFSQKFTVSTVAARFFSHLFMAGAREGHTREHGGMYGIYDSGTVNTAYLVTLTAHTIEFTLNRVFKSVLRVSCTGTLILEKS